VFNGKTELKKSLKRISNGIIVLGNKDYTTDALNQELLLYQQLCTGWSKYLVPINQRVSNVKGLLNPGLCYACILQHSHTAQKSARHPWLALRRLPNEFLSGEGTESTEEKG
jgi:hypothetical protein